MTFRAFFWTAMTAAILSHPGMAQDATPTPAQSVESFQSWTVECATAADDAATRICEAAQTYKNQKTGNEVARVAFGLLADEAGGKKTMRLGMRSLVDVSFATQPEIWSGDKSILTGQMQRCTGGFCYSSFVVTDPDLETLQAASDLKLRFPIGNGSQLQIDMSANGLKDALVVLRSRSAP
jgi:invasion protein IalB